MGDIFARNGLKWEISESQRLRHEAVASYLAQTHSAAKPPTIILHDILFDSYPKQFRLLKDTIDVLKKDQNVCNSFPKTPSCDGLPLEQTGAMLVPISKLSNPGDREQMGITEAAFLCLEDDIKKNPDGLTIRERPKDSACMEKLKLHGRYPAALDGTPRMTIDGTPRIAISLSVINEDTLEKLRLTLLHEFMHAHETPAYRPLWNWVHDDLTYLPEYNAMVHKLNLDNSRKLNDLLLWGFSVFGLLLTITQAYLAVQGDNRRWL
jgi:ribosomal protein L30/L7E